MRRIRASVLLAALGVAAVLLGAPTTALADDGGDMYRLYNQWTGEHFYTAVRAERDSLIEKGWSYEGVGWVAPTSGDAVYRLYNPYVLGGDHHYTKDKGEYDRLQALGWKGEGRGWYSAGHKDAVELYRQYNPFAETGTHNYTTSEGERDALVGAGWRDEGVGWYALDPGRPSLGSSRPELVETACEALDVPDDPMITYILEEPQDLDGDGIETTYVGFLDDNGNNIAYGDFDADGNPCGYVLTYGGKVTFKYVSPQA